MTSERLLTSANVVFLLVDQVNRQHEVFPAPTQLWKALLKERGLLIISNEVEWPAHYFDGQDPSAPFVADLELLIDCLAFDQRPDNSLIVHVSGGPEYRRRAGVLPSTFHQMVTILWKIIEPQKTQTYHQRYWGAPES